MPLRRLYSVTNWNPRTGTGSATDGTSWENVPIEFNIETEGMDSSLNGHLDPGETISAEELTKPDGRRYLYDIVIESGPRSLSDQPRQRQLPFCGEVFNPDPQPIRLGTLGGTDCAPHSGFQFQEMPNGITGDTYVHVSLDRLKALEDRVTDLEEEMQYVIQFVPDETPDGE